MDRHFPLLLDPDVYLSSLDRGRGSEEMVVVVAGVLWGVDGVLGGEAGGEAGGEEVVDQDGGFQDAAVVSSECSAEEEGGCAVGSRG